MPALLRDAVLEAQSFVQAPLALAACSALSLAAQGLVNVRRDHHLVGPVSLYLLAVADSGERKTTCDTIFSGALLVNETMLAESVEKWTEQWKKQGQVEGRVEGRVEGEVAVLARLLSKRFGPLDEQTTARLKAATLDQLDIWADRILDAPTLQAVFDGR